MLLTRSSHCSAATTTATIKGSRKSNYWLDSRSLPMLVSLERRQTLPTNTQHSYIHFPSIKNWSCIKTTSCPLFLSDLMVLVNLRWARRLWNFFPIFVKKCKFSVSCLEESLSPLISETLLTLLVIHFLCQETCVQTSSSLIVLPFP